MAAEVMRRRAELLSAHRWAFGFGIAIAITMVILPLRPIDAPLVYDLVPAFALAIVWLASGLVLGRVARHFAALATDLPIARTR